MIGLALAWFRGSAIGKAVAAVAGVLAVLWLAYARGKSAARQEHREADLEGALDVRRRADDALRRHDGDTRPVDDRLRDRSRLRD